MYFHMSGISVNMSAVTIKNISRKDHDTYHQDFFCETLNKQSVLKLLSNSCTRGPDGVTLPLSDIIRSPPSREGAEAHSEVR